MAVADRSGLPLAVHIASASPAAVRLVAPVLERRLVAAIPERLIGDEAYDSDALDAALPAEGVERIAANRSGRTKSHDGRPLRRYRRRWKVERRLAGLHNFRRIVTQYERHVEKRAFVRDPRVSDLPPEL